MKESPLINDNQKNEEVFNLVEVIKKYVPYWPWFLLTSFLSLGLGYAYLRYTPIIYESIAKIKIVDESKEIDINVDPNSRLNGISNINLENDIEILKSYRILRQVAETLNLDISYYEKGTLKSTEIWNTPFVITKLAKDDSLQATRKYEIIMNKSQARITDEKGKVSLIDFDRRDTIVYGLPFSINIKKDVKPVDYEGIKFWIALRSMKETIMELASNLQVQVNNKKSEVLTLSLKGQSAERSEAILNEVINKFNQDGISDRQLVSKRTLEFIDERFLYLSGELDSIEVGKKDYKRDNSLSNIESDAGITLQRKILTQDEAAKLETQVALSGLLRNAVVAQRNYGLLPVDIGLENGGINSLVSEYNQKAIERERLLTSVGANHPTLLNVSSQLERSKSNILNTLNVYQTQLEMSLGQLNREKSQAGYSFSKLPEKEKMLRSIERQQSIKENLYLLLLQKREEAGINFAVTAPSLKVVDYAITDDKSISPKKKLVYPLSFAIGLLLPLFVLYVRFFLDTKVNQLSDIEKAKTGIPILCEIPYLGENKKFLVDNDRSILAESFRILSTNVNYLLPEKVENQGQVIFITSSIKGEGKTLLALNLSLAFASMEKRVLLVGADLRNPQLHTYFNINKNTMGLSDFLADPKLNLDNCLHEGFGKSAYHEVCLSGAVPSNAPVLLSGERFKKFMEIAKKEFDYIVVDTSPTILVTDTLLISQYADITLFVLRAGFTDKKLLEFSKGLNDDKKLPNMGYVLNAAGHGKLKDYNYGYGYGYEAGKDGKSRHNYSRKTKKTIS
jgi:capsular exopolysaccharide synthesis family protein